mmetsp:Transcript_2775/g.7043  ORF Transcript_2775/g.7043 Transcript_2775/m.7043 type:complete len:135 (+) Transcript_2775:638-1042(+)
MRLAALHLGDAGELKRAKEVVVRSGGALTLEDLDIHRRLIVGVGREHTLLTRRQRRVPGDYSAHQATRRLHAHRQGRHVEEHEVPDALIALLRREHRRLDGSTVGNSLIRVDAPAELLALKALDQHLLQPQDAS